jgi:hypothetical protein
LIGDWLIVILFEVAISDAKIAMLYLIPLAETLLPVPLLYVLLSIDSPVSLIQASVHN